MDVIKIKHIPKCIYVTLAILGFMAVGANFSLKIAEKPEESDQIYGLITGLLFLAFLVLAGSVKTTVKFGDSSIIKCKWLCLFWKIDLNNISAVTYTLKSNQTRGGGTSYSFQMMFYVDADNCKVLKEPLKPNIAEECIRRRFNQVKLMKLYQYIENNYSEIAKGYE